MKTDTDLRSFVVEVAGFEAADVQELKNPSMVDLAEIRKGLIMVIARWSPFPILCLQKMRDVVPPRLRQECAKFLILDNDRLPPAEMNRLFGRLLQGSAETFAIRHGRICGEVVGCSDDYQAKILALCECLK